MRYSIGEQLGAMIAHFENDLSEDFDNLATLQKLALASEAFKNFSVGGLEGLKDAFDKGYASANRDLKEMEEHQVAKYERERGMSDLDPEP